ncbi:MAG: nucleoside-diphosphate sugar epimerase/dehydratase [Christensenella sp.]
MQNMTAKKLLKMLGFILLDFAFMLLAWFVSVWFYSYLFMSEAPLLRYIFTGMPLLFAISAVVLILFGLYKNMWRYASVGSFLRVVSALIVVNLLIYIYFRLVMGYWQSPAIPVMACYLSVTLIGGIRILPRISDVFSAWRASHRKNGESIKKIHVLIVGAGQAASMLILDIGRQIPYPEYKVMAIVDDDPRKQGMKMHGVPIVGGISSIKEIVRDFGVEKIFVAIPSATNEQLQHVISFCPTNQCKVAIINSVRDANQGIKGLKDIEPADLLGRKEINLDIREMQEMICGKTVLVTGGGGSIGSELCRQLFNFDFAKLVIFDIYENNAYNLFQELKILDGEKLEKVFVRIGSVQDKERSEEVFREFAPDVVFHAAAYKHVPLMEECPRLAIENNVFGTNNIAALAKQYNAKKFVFISTDKAVNPTNIMGASKNICEKVVLSYNESGATEYVCVRFGNVLGSNGSVVPIFQKQIEYGGPVLVTHPNITRYFMTIPEAARLVMQAAAMAKGGELFVLDMGEPVKIRELAENMIRLSGHIPNGDIKIKYMGLRPGEKLYEELLTGEEGIKKTDRNDIFVAKPCVFSKEEARESIAMLMRDSGSPERLMADIHEMVPEYIQQEKDF